MRRGIDPLATLLAANALTLVGVLLWKWDIGLIVVLSWAEGLIVLMTKLAFAGLQRWPGAMPNLVAGTIVAWLMSGIHLLLVALVVFHFDAAPLAVAMRQAVLPIAAFAASHSYSLWHKWNALGPAALVVDGNMLGAYMHRTLLMQAAVLLGGGIAVQLASPVWILATIVVAKTILDVWLHRRERARANW